MEPWYEIAALRNEVREGRSFNREGCRSDTPG
jgi:hypothetical protein